MNYKQISVFDTETAAEIGRELYVIILDKVVRAEISDIMNYNSKDGNERRIYRLKGVDAFNNTAVDEDFGEHIFFDEKTAYEKVKKRGFPKISAADIDLTDILSLKYTRKSDGHELKAYIAKAGGRQILEKDFYCYSFLRRYETEKKRDEEYRKSADKITRESENNGGEKDENPELGDLYYVSETLYASEEYAARHTTYQYTREGVK